MPLRDHFHAPLDKAHHWEGFHARWAVSMSDALNGKLLPDGFIAEPNVHHQWRVEIDVATWETSESERSPHHPGNGSATALATPVWTAPPPTWVVPAAFLEEIEVKVFDRSEGLTLVAAIEIVSPANKDRPESRRAFAAKCASYLSQGISLIIIDIVTNRLANLHNETLRILKDSDAFQMPADAALYANAYRPARRQDREEIDIWPKALQLGQPLPTLPLGITHDLTVPIHLETTYTEACQALRIR